MSKNSRKRRRELVKAGGQAVEQAPEVESVEQVPILQAEPLPKQSPARRISAMRAEVYQGYVPHPEHAERYEALLPGSTDRFITMAEKQSTHRHSMEKTYLWFNGLSQTAGVVIAGLAVLGGIAGGIFLIYHDKNAIGLAALLTPLATVGSIFLVAKSKQQKDMAKKNQLQRR